LEKAGHPVIRIAQNSIAHIGQEFFRFEIATAIAGAVLEINPFDQPDVEASKVKTHELTAAFEKSGALPRETPVCSEKSLALYTDEANAEALRKDGADGGVESWLKAHFARIGAGDYVAILAYLDRDEANAARLQRWRLALRDNRHVATCLEFGPRFLHSTGQAYKGGPDSGVFLQITSDDAEDLASSRLHKRAAISAFSSNAAGARCAFTSTAMWSRASPRSRRSSNARWLKEIGRGSS
jgi:transaldolase/glucose-6-phosphate isomerase